MIRPEAPAKSRGPVDTIQECDDKEVPEIPQKTGGDRCDDENMGMYAFKPQQERGQPAGLFLYKAHSGQSSSGSFVSDSARPSGVLSSAKRRDPAGGGWGVSGIFIALLQIHLSGQTARLLPNDSLHLTHL